VKYSKTIIFIYITIWEVFDGFFNIIFLLQLSSPTFTLLSYFILRAHDKFPKWCYCSILTYILYKQSRLWWPCCWYVLLWFMLTHKLRDVEVQLRLRVTFAFEYVVESILLQTTTLSFWSFILLRWRSIWHLSLEPRTKQPTPISLSLYVGYWSITTLLPPTNKKFSVVTLTRLCINKCESSFSVLITFE